jgi:hypothetical protein
VDLLGVAGVVEHHQHAPVGEDGPVQRGPVLQLDGHIVDGHTEREQELGEHVDRTDRRVLRVEATHARVQLPVRERGRHPVRPQHRERGLAHPGRPGQHADRGGLAWR